MNTGRSSRRFFAGFLIVSLLVAGVASFYASTHPDVLTAVAEQTGLSQQEQQSPTADAPLAGYETNGIADGRLSSGVAGVAGCLLVLGIGGGLFRVLRRRGPEGPDPETSGA
jgi:hypothetical protein